MAEDKITQAAEAIKALSESVPLYQDAIQPAAVEVGKALGTVGKAVNVALAPLRGMIWCYDQIATFLESRVPDKLRHVPPERIVTPDPTVAGPAIEALRFAAHKEELREMYASLIARAMDLETKESAHPSFVGTIGDLTTDEALVLTLLYRTGKSYPVVDLRAEYKAGHGTGGFFALRNFSCVGFEAECSLPSNIPEYTENLQRLGLVEVLRDTFLTAPGAYDAVEAHELHESLRNQIGATENREVKFSRHVLQLTNLGRQFA